MSEGERRGDPDPRGGNVDLDSPRRSSADLEESTVSKAFTQKFEFPDTGGDALDRGMVRNSSGRAEGEERGGRGEEGKERDR